MKKETIKNIFEFIERKDNRKTPFVWKLINNEPLTEDDLIINDNLDLSNRKITSLPEGLKVDGYLDLRKTKITSLPEGLQVGDNLHIYSTTLANFSDEELREMVKPGFIKGKIYR